MDESLQGITLAMFLKEAKYGLDYKGGAKTADQAEISETEGNRMVLYLLDGEYTDEMVFIKFIEQFQLKKTKALSSSSGSYSGTGTSDSKQYFTNQIAVMQKRDKFSPLPFQLCYFDFEIEYVELKAAQLQKTPYNTQRYT